MGPSKGFASKPHSHCPAYSLHGPKADILIKNDGHACLSDFSLVTIVADQSTEISTMEGGTIYWMSPELLDPGRFGLRKSRSTKESDCYTLGMVMYEVLSGQPPFAPYKSAAVIWKVLDGQRPDRPQGEEGKLFTDAIWQVLQLCWKQEPKERANARTVLSCLGETPSSMPQPSPDPDGIVEADIDEELDTTEGDASMFPRFTEGLGVSPSITLVARQD